MSPHNFRRCCSAFSALALLLIVSGEGALAQDKNGKDGAQPQDAAAKDGQRKVDEIADAARLLKGPAGSPECVWTGRRIVSLLWRDDLDTAARHRTLYDRFGCPGGHVQAVFRCVVRQGDMDPKAQSSLNDRVHACWINPDVPPSPPPSAQETTSVPQGTAAR